MAMAKSRDNSTAKFYHALGERCARANITYTICITNPLGYERGSGEVSSGGDNVGRTVSVPMVN